MTAVLSLVVAICSIVISGISLVISIRSLKIAMKKLAEQQEANRISRELLSIEQRREKKTNPLTARGGFSSGAPR